MNDKPIIITDSSEKANNCKVYSFDNTTFTDLQKLLKSDLINGVCLVSNDLENDWERFQLNFKVIEAAGGKVLNESAEVLFIYRFDKWDLPKGHIEKGENREEAAIREVEEECGVDGLVILEQLETTYHVFHYKEELRLKVTYWFLMETSFNGLLIPQEEEGITKTLFLNSKEARMALENTYPNIQLLFN